MLSSSLYAEISFCSALNLNVFLVRLRWEMPAHCILCLWAVTAVMQVSVGLPYVRKILAMSGIQVFYPEFSQISGILLKCQEF